MPKEYSCVKRTKRTFERSLAALSREYPLNKVTVKMLCERAELSRNAFYFHYKDINDMVKTIEDGIIDEVSERLEELRKLPFPENVFLIAEAIIDVFDRKREYVLMLFDKSYSASFVKRLYDLFEEVNYEYFSIYHPASKKATNALFYSFITGGFYDSLRYWLENPEDVSKQDIIYITKKLMKRLILPTERFYEK